MKKIIKSLGRLIRNAGNKASAVLTDNRGELATNTIGGIIVAVVIIGLLVMAVNAFFPNLFSDMFSSVADKLNANW